MTRGSRSLSALLSKKNGALFEAQFELACARAQLPVALTRIPDGCKQVNAMKIVRVKSPWDFVISRAGKIALIDTKSCEDAFGFAMVDANQVNEMSKHGGATGPVRSGYVILFRRQGIVAFVPSPALAEAINSPVRGSFGPMHPAAVLLGNLKEMQPWKILLP